LDFVAWHGFNIYFHGVAHPLCAPAACGCRQASLAPAMDNFARHDLVQFRGGLRNSMFQVYREASLGHDRKWHPTRLRSLAATHDVIFLRGRPSRVTSTLSCAVECDLID
jgi:hypothetical protein